MSNTIFTVTDDILEDDSIDVDDPCGCYIHAAILERLNCNKMDVVVGLESIKIGEEHVDCSLNLKEWQESHMNWSNEYQEFGPQGPVDIIWDEKQNLLYLEGEEFDE